MTTFNKIFGAILLVGAVVIGLTPANRALAAPGGNRDLRREAQKPADEGLRELLTAQVAAWNHGDIPGFMEGYWKSDQTTFSGASGVTRGWQAVLDRYRKNYATRAAMGRLEFSDLEITPLGGDAALILGRWHLDRDSGPTGGVFTLVARRLPEGWRIIHDHTSEVASDKK